MDDLTVSTSSVQDYRWILQGLDKLILWVRMSFKPTKARLVVLKKKKKKDKVEDKLKFTLVKAMIPTLTEKPMKSPGENISL